MHCGGRKNHLNIVSSLQPNQKCHSLTMIPEIDRNGVLVRGQCDDVHTNNRQLAHRSESACRKSYAHKWSPSKSPNAMTLPSPSSRPRVPAETRALREKRFGGKGQSAVVGAAKRARVAIKRRNERRRGGLRRRMSMVCSSLSQVHSSRDGDDVKRRCCARREKVKSLSIHSPLPPQL